MQAAPEEGRNSLELRYGPPEGSGNASEKKAAKENYLALEQSIDALGASLEPVRLKLSHYLA